MYWVDFRANFFDENLGQKNKANMENPSQIDRCRICDLLPIKGSNALGLTPFYTRLVELFS
mgnify:CR=1 FL=1